MIQKHGICLNESRNLHIRYDHKMCQVLTFKHATNINTSNNTINKHIPYDAMPYAIQKRSKEYLLHLFNIKVSKCATYMFRTNLKRWSYCFCDAIAFGHREMFHLFLE